MQLSSWKTKKTRRRKAERMSARRRCIGILRAVSIWMRVVVVYQFGQEKERRKTTHRRSTTPKAINPSLRPARFRGPNRVQKYRWNVPSASIQT